jgi:hypothetical protein
VKLLLTTNEGVLLDEIQVTRTEFEEAQTRSVAALNLVCSLSAGKEAK